MESTTPLTLVYAKIEFEGVHFWKDAPDEVAYLREKHRHIFYVKAFAVVWHDDRDVEFIMLGHRIKTWIKRQYPKYSSSSADETVDINSTSCERLAKTLLDTFGLYSCEVSEDNENGAVVIRQ